MKNLGPSAFALPVLDRSGLSSRTKTGNRAKSKATVSENSFRCRHYADGGLLTLLSRIDKPIKGRKQTLRALAEQRTIQDAAEAFRHELRDFGAFGR